MHIHASVVFWLWVNKRYEYIQACLHDIVLTTWNNNRTWYAQYKFQQRKLIVLWPYWLSIPSQSLCTKMTGVKRFTTQFACSTTYTYSKKNSLLLIFDLLRMLDPAFCAHLWTDLIFLKFCILRFNDLVCPFSVSLSKMLSDMFQDNC